MLSEIGSGCPSKKNGEVKVTEKEIKKVRSVCEREKEVDMQSERGRRCISEKDGEVKDTESERAR